LLLPLLNADSAAVLALLLAGCFCWRVAGVLLTARGPRQTEAEREAIQARAGRRRQVRLGRIVALYYHSSTLYQIHEHIRHLYF
jgi:hypothetical protein